MRYDAHKATDAEEWLWGTGDLLMITTDLKENGKSVRLELGAPQTRGPWAISALRHESRIDRDGGEPESIPADLVNALLGSVFCRPGLDGCLSAAARAR
jgi:hypothetical protein